MTFKAWLMLQMKRDDRVGDLARDVSKDRTWPTTQDMVKLRQYVGKRDTLANAPEALDRAYSSTRNRARGCGHLIANDLRQPALHQLFMEVRHRQCP
ncbi:MAG: YozE family protein [Desulfosudis oleivorans]|nr:YozE family protein [Desulfosudis oleivorans]